jgi:heterodisulfide reductase subunit B
MKHGYFPGCSLEGISAEYDHSIHKVLDALEVATEDVPDWICCGTLAAPSTSHLLGLATPLWNVLQAKKAGHDQVIVPCSAVCITSSTHPTG